MPLLLEERWKEKSAPALPEDRGICSQDGHRQGTARPGWKLTDGFLGERRGIKGTSSGCSCPQCSLGGAQLHSQRVEPNPDNHE